MPKIRKKRVGFAIDMTPLVDVTFLLLTFFMFTAKFKNEAEAEQKFQIKRPEASADTTKLPDKDLATIKIAIDSVSLDTAYYYAVLNDGDRKAVYEKMNLSPEQQKPQIKIKNVDDLGGFIAQTRVVTRNKTKFSIDCDKRIRYVWVEQLMEVMRKQGATSFSFVTEKRQ